MNQVRHIEALLEGCSREELLALIEYIARQLCQREERKPQPLYGIWRGKFPEDADIDTMLQEIRSHGGKDSCGPRT